jgi:hypothetical protein
VATGYTIDELISVCIARQVTDGDVLVQGIATPLVMAGYLLAKYTHARDDLLPRDLPVRPTAQPGRLRRTGGFRQRPGARPSISPLHAGGKEGGTMRDRAISSATWVSSTLLAGG